MKRLIAWLVSSEVRELRDRCVRAEQQVEQYRHWARVQRKEVRQLRSALATANQFLAVVAPEVSE